ncbi:PaiB family negative transcriptional regulator [Kordia periserrulae]|uniref:PaiB family negative transcriptional regulator n=1 Tax=Kordia periserrulae TaxID=701523 RepID=A0A2T6BY26_9FLAO|nr:FMN-binding negative transcriptional regulator [Kordia periserrulae]PTX60948.1 PaiB family negative transcriptional regulator [Kordia periserrulae]
MNYPPKHHQETDFTTIVETIKRYPLATLISAKDSEIFTTHVPLMYQAVDNGLGCLIGHIDKFNPQVALLRENIPAQAIFHGPDCYISPNVYSTTQLPTWNYVKVHISAKATRISNKNDIIQSIADMTAFLETSDAPYILDTQHPRVQSLADYIVGFKLEITSWEGKFKLSQDKSPKDKRLAKEALLQESRKDITAFLDMIIDW